MDISEVWLVVIGAFLGFILSIGTIMIQSWLDKRGKLCVFYKLVYSKFLEQPCGFYKSEMNAVILSIPMHMELQNTSNTTRVIRDVCVLLFRNGERVEKMIQAAYFVATTRTGGEVKEKKEVYYGSDKGSYSFVIPPRSIQRQDCEFLLRVYDVDVKSKAFDELKMRYFDEKNNEHVFPLRKIDRCWEPHAFEIDREWVLLNKR